MFTFVNIEISFIYKYFSKYNEPPTQNSRRNSKKLPNVKIEINEDPEQQGEKFHLSGNEEEINAQEDNNGKDSFDDF